MTTRSKPTSLALGTSGATGTTSGVARPTLASKAKATVAENKTEFHAGKRKREALGEVVVADNKPAAAPLKGKEKEVLDGVILKPRAIGALRQPLRTVASRQTTQKTTVIVDAKHATAKRSEQKDAVQNDQAMAVDPPPKVPLPSITTRRSNVSTKISAGAGHNRVASRSSRGTLQGEYEEPVQKKRRTSSPSPEDARAVQEARALAEEKAHNERLAAEMQAFANEVEHDPENCPWDDLDTEDSDDHLMVSEYVQDIFTYMKKLEVRSFQAQEFICV
jgi:G2/mitotic-specific cyclin 1/2